MSDGGSTGQNGTTVTANDCETVCKPDGELDSSENANGENEKMVVENVDKDEQPGENIEMDKEEKVCESDGLGSEENENEEKSPKDPIEIGCEKEQRINAADYKDDMNVVLREDLKVVFQQFGTVKVSSGFFFLFLYLRC